MKRVDYTRDALRTLRKMTANTAARIRHKVADYAADPQSQANYIKALKGRDGVRLRVGNWRVIMHDGVVLTVLEVGPRGSIYDD